MRKRHFLALFCALLLLLALPACKRKEEPSPEAGDSGHTESTTGTEGGEAESSNGPFSVRFDKNGTGFDTDKGQLFTPTTTTARDFSGDLDPLRNRMVECNAFAIGSSNSNLTYKALSGNTPTTAGNTLYTIRFTADGETHTITIDDAAIAAYRDTDSNVSNISALVDSFVSLTALWNGSPA